MKGRCRFFSYDSVEKGNGTQTHVDLSQCSIIKLLVDAYPRAIVRPYGEHYERMAVFRARDLELGPEIIECLDDECMRYLHSTSTETEELESFFENQCHTLMSLAGDGDVVRQTTKTFALLGHFLREFRDFASQALLIGRSARLLHFAAVRAWALEDVQRRMDIIRLS